MMFAATVLLAGQLMVEQPSFAAIEADVPVHDPKSSMWENRGPAKPTDILSMTVQLSVDADKRDALEAAF